MKQTNQILMYVNNLLVKNGIVIIKSYLLLCDQGVYEKDNHDIL